jgi:signal transduction histidine kinase/CheY-like chemotaxis protein
MNHTRTAHDVLVGPGKMAALLRSHSWASTPLGEVSTWPPGLTTTLGILLNARSPMVCLWGSDRLLFYNDACAALLAHSPYPWRVGQSLRGLEAGVWQPLGHAFEQVFATGQPLALDATRGNNPLTVFYRWACSPIWGLGGEVAGVFATGTVAPEVEGFPKTEAALWESEEQLRMAQRAAGAGLWDWDMVTNQVTWSEEYYHLYGLPPTVEPSYANWIGSILPQDRDRVEAAAREAIEQGKNLKTTFRIAHPADGQRWLMVIGQTFYGPGDQPIRMTGIALNITEQKRAEQALVESEALAKTRAEELSALMEATPAAIWIAHDADCNQVTANRMAYELMQIDPGEMPHTSMADPLAALPFEQRKQGRELLSEELPLQRAICTGQESTDEVEFVFPDGTVRTIYGKAVPLYDSAGAVRGAIAGFTEITALKQSEQAHEQLLQRERCARAEAEKANHLKDQFLAVLSHELRSPLNPILGWARLLQTRTFDAAKTAQALDTIERNARLQAQLVDDLLDLAKILRGKLHLQRLPVNVAGAIESALEAVKAAAAAKAITLQLDLEPGVQVSGDGARLQQIVWNLLSNAIKFTPSQGQVTIQLRARGDRAEVTVTDTGIGISADFLPHLFESFRQEDISITRKHGGLGLGLAIVQQLVEAHEGTITAYSPGEGQGATFVLRLPRLATPVGPTSRTPRSVAEIDLAGIRVVAVDDSDDTRDLLSALLGQYGAEVTTVDSALAALEALKTQRPNVLISDIGMPDIDGYSLIKQIRALPFDQGGRIPAIALTAYVREADQQQALASGYQRHLAKPLNVEKVVAAVFELAQGAGAAGVLQPT